MFAGGDLVGAYAEMQPDVLAVVDDRNDGNVKSLTYKQLDEEANRVAQGLLRAGLLPGERVAWGGRNAIEVLAVSYGTTKAGGTAPGLNHRLQREEVLAIAKEANIAMMFVDTEFAPTVIGVEKETPVRLVVVYGGDVAGPGQIRYEDFLAGCSTEKPTVTRLADPPPSISFSSGTTGRPKIILRGPQRPDCSEMRHQDVVWGPGPHVFITSGAMSSGASGGFAFSAIARGGSVVLQRKFDAEDWMRLVDRYKVTFAYCSPTVIRQICALPDEIKAKYDLSSIRTVFAGAAKWSYALKLAYRDTFPPNTLWEIYGSTELGSNTVMRPDEHWGKPESCGKPVPGVDIVLLDEEGNEITEPNVQGVLYARSDSFFIGYENDPVAYKAAQWGDGFVTVGDIAYRDEDGYYYICDRQKDMIVSGGINVYPAEIEAVLDSYPGILEATVFGIPDDQWGESVHAVIVPKEGVTLDEAEIRAYCREHLASHKVPRSMEYAAELPHTLSGKVLKRELRNKYWEGTGRLI